MKSIVASIKLILFIITAASSAQAALIPPHRSTYCAGLFMGVRALHEELTASSDLTQHAFQRLSDFRIRHLPTANTSEVTTHSLFVRRSTATQSELAQVEEELAGLALQYTDGQAADQTNLIAGVSIKKAERIQKWLKDVNSFAENASRFYFPQNQDEAFGFAQVYTLDSFALAATLLGGISLYQTLAHPELISPITLAATASLIYCMDRLGRVVHARTWPYRRQQKAFSAFLEGDDRDWIFTSATYRWPLYLATELWKTQELSRESLWQMRQTDRETDYDRQLYKHLLKIDRQADFVTVDQLLRRDPQTGHPELIVFLRTSGQQIKSRRRKKDLQLKSATDNGLRPAEQI